MTIARNGVVARLFRSKLKGIAEIASLLSVARNDNAGACHCEGGTTEAIYSIQALVKQPLWINNTTFT